MDEMKLKLSSGIMRGIAAKLLSKAIYNKFGFKPKIRIEELSFEMKDGTVYFHINADGEADQKSFLKITELIDKD